MLNETSKSMQDVYRAPGHLFRRMQQIAVAIFMEECGAALDLTPVQFAALVAIRDYPDIDATRLSALIAGGGIGGLAAALGPAHKGLRITVLEKAAALGEIGAGIQLGPNAFHAFD